MTDPDAILTRDSPDVVSLYVALRDYPELVGLVDERLRQWGGAVTRRAFEETARNVLYPSRLAAIRRQRKRDAIGEGSGP